MRVFDPRPKEFEVTVRIRNNLLKERRDKLGYTQREMALVIGIPLAQYGALENLGKSPLTDDGEWSSFALKTAEYHDCEPSDLFPESIMRVTDSTATRKLDGAEMSLLMSGYNQETASGSEQRLLDAAKATDEQYVFRRSMSRLRPIEADIMQSNLGVGLKEPESLDDIADRYHLSRERVRQIKEQGLGKARKDIFHRMGDSKVFHVLLAGPFEKVELDRLIDLVTLSLKTVHPEAVVRVSVDDEAKEKVVVYAYGFMGEGYETIEDKANAMARTLYDSRSWRNSLPDKARRKT